MDEQNRKESADMLEHARQINQDADLIGEQIILTKKQQFCIAKHLQGFRLLENGDTNIVSVCNLCKYVTSCAEKKVLCRIEMMELFQRLTGVDLTSWRQRTIEELPDYLLDYTPSDRVGQNDLEQRVAELKKEVTDLKQQLKDQSDSEKIRLSYSEDNGTGNYNNICKNEVTVRIPHVVAWVLNTCGGNKKVAKDKINDLIRRAHLKLLFDLGIWDLSDEIRLGAVIPADPKYSLEQQKTQS